MPLHLDAVIALVVPPAELGAEFERLHGHRAPFLTEATCAGV
jgi:hypothetical protein